MADLNDRNTDALFQAGAERHEFDYNPDAWALMEEKLDAQEAAAVPPTATKRAVQRGLPLLLLLLLVFGAGAYLYLDNYFSSEQPPINTAIALNGEKRNNINGATDEDSNISLMPPPVATMSPGTVGPANVAGGTTPRTPTHGTPTPRTPTHGTPTYDTLTQGTPAHDIPTPQNPTKRTLDKIVHPIKIQAAELEIDSDWKIPPIRWQPDTQTSFKAAPVNNLAATLSAGLVSGSSSGAALPRAQARFGLLGEYRVGNKLSVSTGAHYSMVHYRIEGERYKAKDGFFEDNIQPEEVKAACSLLEIPIYATYNFSGSRNNSFYTGVGAVSYVLLKESYQYKYSEENAGLKKEWEEVNANRHPFGVGEINIGYRRQMPGRSALQLESFFHLPLTGVGHGDVRVLSAGVSLKYQFGF